jgi:hypothetical protein
MSHKAHSAIRFSFAFVFRCSIFGSGRLAPNHVFHFPYSAKFYTGGRAKYIRDEDGLVTALDRGEQYFVIPVKNYPTLSATVKPRLEIITEQNGHLLLRSR